MKRTLSLVLALVMVLGTFTTVFAAADPTAAEAAGKFLEDKGVLVGDDKTGDLMLGENLKRQDMVVLLSRLMGVEDVAKEFPVAEEGLGWEDVEDPYYVPYLSWAKANKLVKGIEEDKFGFDETVTAQDYALLLLRVLGYEDAVWEDALEDAKELGILENVTVEDKTPVVRGTMAVLVFNALSVKVKDSEETLAEKLEIEMPVPAVLEVEEVVADNLKEVKVVFNKDVDVELDDVELYSIRNVVINDATVEGNMVVLDVSELANKRAYELVIKGAEDIDGKYAFTAYDNAVPFVTNVEALGTKAIKVTMSEPVKKAEAKNFRLNGNLYFGSVDVVGKEIMLTPYNNVLTVGNHELRISSLEDFAGFKSLETVVAFEVVEDKVAPEVIDVTGTLERIVVTFSEDIDPVSVNNNTLYWNNKANIGKAVRLAGNKYAFEFTNSLPIYEVTLHIQGAKDYSGNTMKATEWAFKGQLDDVRPEVVDAYVTPNTDAKEITVKFSKPVQKDDLEKSANYTLTDKDKTVVRIEKVDLVNDREASVKLYNKLSTGATYTLKVEGIRDRTKLQNTMLPFEGTVSVAGAAVTTNVVGAYGNADERTIQVVYNKAMDLATIANKDNYILDVDGTSRLLSGIAGSDLDVIDGGKAVIISLPEMKSDGVVLKIGTHIKTIMVVGARDVDGGLINNHGKAIDIETADATISKATATSKTKVVVEFNQPIYHAVKEDFKIAGVEVTAVEVDGSNKVTLTVKTLDADAYKYKVEVVANNKIETLLGNKAAEDDETLIDKIAPSLIRVENVKDSDEEDAENKVDEFVLVFDEELDNEGNIAFLFAQDIKIVKFLGEKTLQRGVDFTTKLEGKTIIVTIENDELLKTGSKYGVQIDNPRYIQDKNQNVVNKSVEKEVELDAVEAVTPPTDEELLKALVDAKDEDKLFEALQAIKTAGKVEAEVIESNKSVYFSDTEKENSFNDFGGVEFFLNYWNNLEA